MKIDVFNIFPTPIFQVPLPQMRPYHDEILALFQGKIDSGEIQPHQLPPSMRPRRSGQKKRK